MFYYDDLNIYSNSLFRSSCYTFYLWSLIESDLIFLLGLTSNTNITIIFDSDMVYLQNTSNFKTLVDKKYKVNIKHSLNICEELSAEVVLNVSNAKKFIISYTNKNLYYTKSIKDEGIIEIEADVSLNLLAFLDFKESILIQLTKLFQFAICRNILYLEIEEDSVVTEIDADFEIIKILQKIKNLSFISALDYAIRNKLVHIENKEFIEKIEDFSRSQINV